MELKPYQKQVIADLTLFLDYLNEMPTVQEAYYNFWIMHPRTPLFPVKGQPIEPYKNNIEDVPHVCIKVPTAGGKTFIACNALKPIFDAFDYDAPKAVVWLVPSITILEQTLNNLKDPSHPYRQKINAHFGSRVNVYEKNELLQGAGFNASIIEDQLTIMVFSYDSLRSRNKEDRKVFQENGNLQSFEYVLEDEDEITLGAVIRYLNPVVIVDESHNAETDLSLEMLSLINPCFILDLTATPRRNSNIVSFIDALELKKEHMVKLPVIVYNHQDKTEVVNSALQLQKRLEDQAKEEEKKGGKYIRPIVLFQAQPKTNDDNTTFERLKEKLIDLKIPPEQIRIKTANINEIRNEDLMNPDCPVRYIITVNALKEGWDCPFAYILASLADKTSTIDVEQILGRVLRQPHVMHHAFPLLNMSYVLTASGKFMDTLENIVQGLNKAGFSDRDYKVAESMAVNGYKQETAQQLSTFSEISDEVSLDIDISRIVLANDKPSTAVITMEEAAIQQNTAFEKTVQEMEDNDQPFLPEIIRPLVKTYEIKEVFKEMAASIVLPQFHFQVEANHLFGYTEEEALFEKEELLDGFPLSKCDTHIVFAGAEAQLYKVDLDVDKKERTPTFLRVDGIAKSTLMAYILDPSRRGTRVKNLTKRIMDLIGNMYPIPDREMEKYVNRILEGFEEDQFNDFADNEYMYVSKIKQKITQLADAYAERRFSELLDTDNVFVRPSYHFPKNISPGEVSKNLPKTLYEKESKMNGFEERIINEIANMPSIHFWTRNTERRGFRINGFINHYPDFIVYTKSGKVLVIETKGDHLDAEQKTVLGELWESKAGNRFRYFMVYENREVRGAYKADDFLEVVRKL